MLGFYYNDFTQETGEFELAQSVTLALQVNRLSALDNLKCADTSSALYYQVFDDVLGVFQQQQKSDGEEECYTIHDIAPQPSAKPDADNTPEV